MTGIYTATGVTGMAEKSIERVVIVLFFKYYTKCS